MEADTIVYTVPSCLNCRRAKAALMAKGRPFKEVALNENPDILLKLTTEGFKAAPVIEMGGARMNYDDLLLLLWGPEDEA